MLVTRDLIKEYSKKKVVNRVNVKVGKGEIVGLLGPNGAGKTTTFYMIVGLIRPTAGQILLDDKDITHLPMYKRARRGIGYLSQESSIFRKLTVAQNIEAILETQKLSRREREVQLEELLGKLKISHLASRKAYFLSGGERRKVEITRALVMKPSYILLDEPFAGIDPIAVKDMQDIVLQLKEMGLGVIITDHNVRETLAITDKSYIIYEGRILLSGPADVLAKDIRVRKVYLGEHFQL
jgi:lipopolysaccharide export system ATP-binding protein